jgi:signal peptidase I
VKAPDRPQDDLPAYHAAVGVLLGLVLHGSAHFLSGSRAAGLAWFVAIAACEFLALPVMAFPGLHAVVIGGVLLAVAPLLWLVMLATSYRPVRRFGVVGWVLVILIGTVTNSAFAHGLRAVVQTLRIASDGMAPTLLRDDLVFVDKVAFRRRGLRRGDVVVFPASAHAPWRETAIAVQRIAGLPGDTVRIAPPNLIVNDQIVTDPPIFGRIASARRTYGGFRLAKTGCLTTPADQVVLGPDQYLVLGDNAARSFDGRNYGPISGRSVIGRATRVIWPPYRIRQPLDDWLERVRPRRTPPPR